MIIFAHGGNPSIDPTEDVFYFTVKKKDKKKRKDKGFLSPERERERERGGLEVEQWQRVG